MTSITITSDFDATAVAELRPLFEMVGAGTSDISVDFSATTFMDPSGVGAIAYLFKRLRARGFNLSLLGLQGQPLMLLRKLGLTSLFPAPVQKLAA
jgi:anti-sigma B factor antagonist